MPTTNAGQAYGIGFGPGLSTADELTNSGNSSLWNQVTGAVTDNIGSQSSSSSGSGAVSAVWWLVGIALVLVVLKYASEHEKSGLDPKLLGIGLWNLVAVTLMAVLGVAALKTIVNKYPVKGLTNLVNIV